jgi:cytochrome c oxidase subunit 2
LSSLSYGVRRGAIIELVAIGAVVAGVCTAVALLLPWLPNSASEQSARIDWVFWTATGVAIWIFSTVVSILIYSLLHFRAPEDDFEDGPPIHGNSGLEIVWTLIPTVIVTALSILSAVVLADNGRAASDPLTIDVTARQFAWSFTYPGKRQLTTTELGLPLGRTVVLRLHSEDVIHAFWVPEFGQSQDAVPGQVDSIVVTPKRTGTFPVICVELCGVGHAYMRSQAIVMPPSAYETWLQQQASGGSTAGATAAAVFKTSCGGCHTLSAAGTSGTVGPDLDKLAADAQKANRGSLAAYTRESILSPDAYIVPGYQPNVMPKNFGSTLSKQQLQALVQYLASSSKGGK